MSAVTIFRALVVAFVLMLSACVTGDPPCSDLAEEACLDDDRCAAEYLESCGCSCADDTCGEGCCEFGPESGTEPG